MIVTSFGQAIYLGAHLACFGQLALGDWGTDYLSMEASHSASNPRVPRQLPR
jgi:hypothetical protein